MLTIVSNSVTSIAGLMTWFGISVTYIRFHKGMKAQGIDRKTLPYYSNLQPYAAWYAAVFCIVICFVSAMLRIGSHKCSSQVLYIVQRMGRLPEK